jgi:hypothetical protein
MATNENLWPDDLVEKIPRTPVHILREQATALGEKTNNVVQAKVRTNTDRDGYFHLTFVLTAPTLQGYEYELFAVFHDEGLYPVHNGDDLCDDEESLKAYLKSLFSSERTKRIVRALVAQARTQSDLAEDDDIPF